MLHVHYSNRLEILTDQLSSVLTHPIASPFTPESIVVESDGMARWLAMRLAERLGVCANVRFPFPARFIWEIFGLVLPDVPRTSPFEPAVMAWRIVRLLDDVVGLTEFRAVQEYLSDDDDLKRYQLACSIAEMFDRYLVYRPEWIRRWEAGEEGHWQAELWRRLVRQEEAAHWVHIQDAFLNMLQRDPARVGELPARTCLFGISVLSPSYLQVLAGLADVMDVHMFVVNPCRKYWGEIVSDREKVRRSGQDDPETLYLETGNSLLASLGRQGRDFIDMLLDYSHQEHEAFEESREDSALHILQTDVLDLREPGTDERPPALFASDDRSVQVHVCHSALREVEILHDQLLALFESDPDLDPSNVIVMTPDLNAYAPYIEAVFGAADKACRIPFNISDRGVHSQRVLVDVFFDILELVDSRLEAPKVLGLLEAAAVRKRFGFDDDDVVRIREWVRNTGVRWGADARSRAEQGLPATSEHTWRSGLDRLLAGYALPDENTRLFEGIAPYEHVEGSEAQVMGRLQMFAEEVIGLQTRFRTRRTVAKWNDILQDMLDRFLEPSAEEEGVVHSIRQVIDGMRQQTERAGYTTVISLDVIKDYLRRELDARSARGPFLTGAVTCCAMIPRRSIPFEVICLIGMNDGSYPRARRSPGFDLMSHAHRRGDRLRRDDDRYLFLETLLSARRVLYLSYVGRSIRDDTVLPPSALVSELFDYLKCAFRTDDGTDILSQVVTQHPLQPYSWSYFSGEARLFSYSRAMCVAGRAGSQSQSSPFIAGELPEAEPERRTIDLEQLVRFFSNPTRFLLQLRLGIYLSDGAGRLDTREPFSLDPLERWQLRNQLLDLKLAGEPASGLLPFARTRGMLPHGQVGDCVFNESLTSVERFVERIEKVSPAEAYEPLEVNLSFDDLRLTGWLPAVGREGRFTYHLGSPAPKRMLELWIGHLVLNALSPPNTRTASRWFGEHEDIVLNPMSNADKHLRRLLQLYWRGLHRPLHFFPSSSFAYARAKFKCMADPYESARRAWAGSDYVPRSECDDMYYQLAYRGTDPLDDEFVDLATAVCTPMLENATGLA